MVKNEKNHQRTVAFIVALLCMLFTIFTFKTNLSAATTGYVKSLKISTSKIKISSGDSKIITASVRTEGNNSQKVKIKISKKDKKIIQIKITKPNKKGVSKLIIKAKNILTEQTAAIKITTKAKNHKQKKISKTVQVTVIPKTVAPSTSLAPSTPSIPFTSSTQSIPSSPTTSFSPTIPSEKIESTEIILEPEDTESTEMTPKPEDLEDIPNPNETEKIEDTQLPDISELPTEPISITELTLDQTKVALEVADRLKLTTTIMPENVTNRELIWSSNDENVAKVNQNGEITAIAPGEATITASTADKSHTAECMVTVVLLPTDIKASLSKEKLFVGELASIYASVVPANATHTDIQYYSSNPEIAYVSSLGTITAISPGEATITVEAENEKKTELKISVSELRATGLYLDKEMFYLDAGSTTSLTASVYPENATTKEIQWSSLNEDIATVNQSGMVRGISAGSTIIRANLEECGLDMLCRVVVTEDYYSNRISLEVMEEFKDNAGNIFNNTKLFHETMKIRVGLFRAGEPQTYIPIELSLDETFRYGNAPDYFELSKPYIITDDSGYGYVEIKLKDAYKDSDAFSGLFQSYVLNAKDSYSQKTAAITVRFASVELNGITVENNLKKEYKNITPSMNTKNSDDGISRITTTSGVATEYVHSQQVSYYEEGNDRNEHKVILSANPSLLLPITRDLIRQDAFEMDVYSDGVNVDTLQNMITNERIYGYSLELPEGIKDWNIQLGTFISEHCQKAEIALIDCKTGEILDSTLRNVSEDMFISDAVKLTSSGNSRCHLVISCTTTARIEEILPSEQLPIAKITGNHALSNNELTVKETIAGAVTWNLVSEEITAAYQSFGMTYEEIEKYISADDRMYLSDTYTYICRIPVTPYIGNAIIEVCNPITQRKIYFAYPTVYQNGSVKLAEPTDSSYAFIVSRDEAFNSTGNIVTEDNLAIIDSTKTGFSAIKANITIPGMDTIKDTGNGTLYSYIQWAPIDYVAVDE